MTRGGEIDSGTVACLSEHTLLRYVAGALDDTARGRADAHVDACPACRELAAHVAKSSQRPIVGRASEPDPVAAPAGGSPGAVEPGQRVNRYLILDLIGTGAMGDVHAAYDAELDRTVALKVLRSGGDGSARSQHRRLLAQEARALAQLNHPNVVTIYDVGTWGDQLFIAMELGRGTTLRGWLATPRDWKEVVAMGVRVGRGLAAAHAAGIVHRDLKPSNVLVEADGRVRVTDFGLAGSVDASAASGNGPSVMVGTPAYMAPEQHRGGRIDARSDQYSLCVVLFEGLFGALSFVGDDDRQLAEHKLRGAVTSIGETRVPALVARAVLRGLEPDPAKRWPTVDALLHELQRAATPRTPRWLPVLAATGFAAVAAVWFAWPDEPRCARAAGQLSGVWDEGRKAEASARFAATQAPYADLASAQVQRRLDHYAARWVELSISICEATDAEPRLLDLRRRCLRDRHRELRAITDVLVDADLKVVEQASQMVAGLRSLDHCADDETLRLSLDAPAEEIADEVEGLRDQMARVEASQWSGRYAEAASSAAAIPAAARVLDYPPVLAEALALRGAAQHRAGEFAAAAEDLQAAIWLAVSLHHDRLTASAATELAYVVGVRLADGPAAHRWARLAESALQSGTSGARERARLHSVVGTVLSAQGQFVRALEQHRAARAVIDALPSAEYESAVESSNIGAVLFSLRRYGEALTEFSRAQRLWEATVGRDHPQLAIALNNAGNALIEQGRHDEARAHYARALEIALRALGPAHPRTALTIANLGFVDLRQRRAGDARKQLERALQLMERAFGARHPNVANVLQNLGDTELLGEHCAAALTNFERAWSIRDEVLQADHPHRGWTLTGLGRAHFCAGDAPRAVSLLERALAHRQAHDPLPRRLATTRFALARSVWAQGRDRERAVGLARHALEEFRGLGEQGSVESAEVQQWLAQR